MTRAFRALLPALVLMGTMAGCGGGEPEFKPATGEEKKKQDDMQAEYHKKMSGGQGTKDAKGYQEGIKKAPR